MVRTIITSNHDTYILIEVMIMIMMATALMEIMRLRVVYIVTETLLSLTSQ